VLQGEVVDKGGRDLSANSPLQGKHVGGSGRSTDAQTRGLDPGAGKLGSRDGG
jgi:hypothetical protein